MHTPPRDHSQHVPSPFALQASFEPLGLTIAVAKDRAIESLMQVRCSAGVLQDAATETGATPSAPYSSMLPTCQLPSLRLPLLAQVGDTFVLNCLGEGEYNQVLKHFLQRFPPGADRFVSSWLGWSGADRVWDRTRMQLEAFACCPWPACEDAITTPSHQPTLPLPHPCPHMQEGIGWRPANNGSPVLESAIAHMECRVVSRMETPDHWICYAEVEEGQVTKPEARTAVHRRKVASYY